MKKLIYIFWVVTILCPSLTYSQWLRPDDPEDSRRNNQQGQRNFMYLDSFNPVFMIDKPTANTLTIITNERQNRYNKYFHVNMRVYNNGGMLAGIDVGLTRALMIGVKFGGQNLIGTGEVLWNEAPGVNMKFKVLKETAAGLSPALSIGYDTQGYGGFNQEDNRYQIKSPGFYIVASKNNLLTQTTSRNFTALNLGFHGGANFSPENGDKKNELNLFFGAHLVLERELALVWEYDTAMNDKTESRYGSGGGYMNVAVRWMFLNQFFLEFALKDITKNTLDENGDKVQYSNRELKIVYRRSLTE